MDSTTALIAARGETHGDWKEQANIAQQLKFVMESTERWQFLNSSQREALHMIACKMSRILSGDSEHKDHWDDISGYAQLVARQCK